MLLQSTAPRRTPAISLSPILWMLSMLCHINNYISSISVFSFPTLQKWNKMAASVPHSLTSDMTLAYAYKTERLLSDCNVTGTDTGTCWPGSINIASLTMCALFIQLYLAEQEFLDILCLYQLLKAIEWSQVLCCNLFKRWTAQFTEFCISAHRI